MVFIVINKEAAAAADVYSVVAIEAKYEHKNTMRMKHGRIQIILSRML